MNILNVLHSLIQLQFNKSYRFAVKVGIASFVLYQLKDYGVWKESDHSVNTINKINESLEPKLRQVRQVIPYKLPKLPQDVSLKRSWNSGVMATFEFLTELPERISEGAKDALSDLANDPDIKKIFSRQR